VIPTAAKKSFKGDFMKELLALICDCLERDRPVALASIIAHQGSAPRGVDSKLVADKNGLLAGTIGGGLLENQALEACRASLGDGKATIFDFALTGEFAAKTNMICGGRLRVLIEPLFPSKEQLQFFLAVRDALSDGEVLLITDITVEAHPRRAARIGNAYIGEPPPNDIVPHLLDAVSPAQGLTIQSHENRSYVIETCQPSLRMIIAGGGHVSRPTAQLASLVGFEVDVLDDRPEFSLPERFPWAAHVSMIPDYLDCFANCAPTPRTYIIIVTRGHLHDAAVLSQALTTKAGYIGMIGSKRKRAEVYAALRTQGVSEEALARVHCPIGLAIGAKTPEEIAVSIVAECIAHHSGPSSVKKASLPN
jgi:xanthine dehydrogenase accessory factor